MKKYIYLALLAASSFLSVPSFGQIASVPFLASCPNVNWTGTGFSGLTSGSGTTCGQSTEANVQQMPGITGHATAFYVNLATAPGAGASIAYTVRKNGANTALTCTVSVAALTCNITGQSVTMSPTDLWDVQVVGASSPAATFSSTTLVVGP